MNCFFLTLIWVCFYGWLASICSLLPIYPIIYIYIYLGLSENVGLIFPMKYPFKNGIMISKTIEYNGVHYFQTHPFVDSQKPQKQSYHDFCRPITGVPSPFAPQKRCWDKISAIRIDWGFCSCWHHGFSQRPTPWPRGIQCRMESGSCKERPGRKMMMIRTAGWNMAKHGFQWMAIFDFWWWKKNFPWIYPCFYAPKKPLAFIVTML